MTQNMMMAAKRLEGRLYVDEGRLYFVLEVNVESGTARVSFSRNGSREIVDVPVRDIAARVSAAANLRLDELNTGETTSRLREKDDGWYFNSRDGLQGPFANEDAAQEALQEHILESQSEA